MKAGAIGASLAAFCAVLSASAVAGEKPLETETRFYFSQPTSESAVRRKGDTLVEVRLLPESLFALQDDLVDPVKGEVLAGRGTQFIPQIVADGSVNHCAHKSLRSNAFTPKIMLCLVGNPNAGPLERYFWTWGAPLKGPGATLFPREDIVTTRPVTLAPAEIASFDGDYKLRLRWQRGDGAAKPIVGAVEFCKNGDCSWSARNMTFAAGENAPPVEIFGRRLTCISAGKDLANCKSESGGRRGYLSIAFWSLALRDEG